MQRVLGSSVALYALTTLLSLLFACLIAWARECP
jgi:ABC-type Fe3+ transport system permease subunit